MYSIWQSRKKDIQTKNKARNFVKKRYFRYFSNIKYNNLWSGIFYFLIFGDKNQSLECFFFWFCLRRALAFVCQNFLYFLLFSHSLFHFFRSHSCLHIFLYECVSQRVNASNFSFTLSLKIYETEIDINIHHDSSADL